MAWSKDSGGIFGFKNLVSLSGKITRGLRNLLLARFQLFSSSANVALSPEIAGTSTATTVVRGLSTLTRGIWEYAQQIQARKKESKELGNVQITRIWATYAVFWYPAHSILLSFPPLSIFFVELFCYLPPVKAATSSFLPYLYLIELHILLSHLKITALEAVRYPYRTHRSPATYVATLIPDHFCIFPEDLITIGYSVFKTQLQ